MFFLFNPLRLVCSRIRKTTSFLTSHRLKKYKNLHPWSLKQVEWKCGKCWKLPIFEGKLRVFFSYLSEMKIVSSTTLPYSSTFYSLFLPFFVLEIFKFKYDKFFIRHSASISKFKWFEQPCRAITKKQIGNTLGWWNLYSSLVSLACSSRVPAWKISLFNENSLLA